MATHMGPPPPGVQPTPQQLQAIQQQIAAEAAKRGISPQQYIEQLRQQQMQQMQQQGHAHAHDHSQHPHGHAHPPHEHGPPQGQAVNMQNPQVNPAALAVANFLRSQELKPRQVIFQEKRKDMFRVKRAIRALNSEAYSKARAKNPLLPEITDRASIENAFKLLPLSVLALRVSKADADEGHEGHSHGKKKRVKGLWTVRIEQQQTADDDDYYIWVYEGSQWMQKLYAAGALALVVAVVMFPLWPLFMRQGVWYLSMGCLGLLGLFFAMAIFRLILFIATMFLVPPGLWLYPNLFEDVGFFDSFRPVWAWQETAEDKRRVKEERKTKRLAKKAKREAAANGKPAKSPKPAAPSETPIPATSATTASGVSLMPGSAAPRKPLQASVEEADDE